MPGEGSTSKKRKLQEFEQSLSDDHERQMEKIGKRSATAKQRKTTDSGENQMKVYQKQDKIPAFLRQKTEA